MTSTILLATQLISAALLIVCILLQQRGQGLSGGLIGSALEYSTKRGVEKTLFISTIAMAVVFFGVSLARLVLGA